MIEFSLDDSGGTGTLVLSGSLTIQNAQPLKDALMKAVSTDRLVMNMEQVEAIDLTAIQLLCIAHRNLITNGKTLDLVGIIPDIIKESVWEAGFLDCTSGNDSIGLWTGEKNV